MQKFSKLVKKVQRHCQSTIIQLLFSNFKPHKPQLVAQSKPQLHQPHHFSTTSNSPYQNHQPQSITYTDSLTLNQCFSILKTWDVVTKQEQ